MKTLRTIIMGLAGLIAVIMLGGFLLPRVVEVDRSITIQAPAEVVYANVSDFRRFNLWSPWAAHEVGTEYTFTTPPGGLGARMTWESEDPNVGSGSQTIVEATPNRFVRTELDFGPQGTAQATFSLVPVGADETQVTWAFSTDLGYDPVARYMGLLFDSWIGADYENGLERLKILSESRAS